MSAGLGDAALFRLRAFEADWLRPMIEEGESDLNVLLIGEAMRWIELGQEAGYFAAGPLSVKFADPDWAVGAFELDNRVAVAPATFARLLAEAQGDLTPARRQFLELAFFASDDLWQERLGQVELAVLEREQSPEATLAGDLIEEIRWGLEGANSEIGVSPPTPALWRSTDLSYLHGLRPEGAKRIAELKRKRMVFATGLGVGVSLDPLEESGGENLAAAAEVLIDSGNLDVAEGFLRKAPPDGTGRTQLQLARVAVRRGRSGEAKELLREAAEANLPVAPLLLGEVLASEGDTAAARETLEQAESNGVPSAAFALANLLSDEGDMESAAAALRRAAAAGEPRALASLAGTAAVRGEPSEAARLLAGAHRTVSADALLQVGRLLSQQGADDEAWEVLLEADLAGAHDAASVLAQLRQRGERFESAEDWYRKAIAAGRTSSHLNLGVLLQRRGDLEGAEAQYRLALGSGDAGAHRNLGLLFMERDEGERALRAFEDAVENDDAKAHLFLARMLIAGFGDPGDAERHLVAAIEAGFDEALFDLEGLLLRQERFDEAGEVLDAAVARDLDSAWCRKGALLARLGAPGARETYEEGTERGDAGAAYNLGVLADQVGDWDGSLAAYERAHELGHVRAANNIGGLFLRREERQAAELWLGRAVEAGDSRAFSNIATLMRLQQLPVQAMAAASIGAREEEPAAFLILAELAEEVGSEAEARSALRDAKRFEVGPAWGRVGQKCLLAEELEEAETELREGWSRSDPLSGLLLSRLLRRTGHAEEAEEVARSLRELNEERGGGEGTAWVSNRIDEAGTPLALVLPIGRADILMEVGAALVERDRLEEALAPLEEAAQLGNETAATNLAILHGLRGDEELERDWLARAAEMDSPVAVLRLGDLHWRQGNYEDAERLMIRADRLGHPYAIPALGKFLLSQGRLAAAERTLALAVERGDGQPDASYDLGVARERRGDLEGAAEAYAEVREELPDAAYNLGVVRDAMGDQQGALAAYRLAAASGHENARSNLGAVLLETGRLDEAEALLAEMAAEGHASAIHNYGNVLLTRGRRDEARAQFEASGEPLSLVSLGKIYRSDGDLPKAAEYLQKALDAGEWRAVEDLGRVYEDLGDPERAVTVYRRGVEKGDSSLALRLGYVTGRLNLADEIVEEAMSSFELESAMILRAGADGPRPLARDDELVEANLVGSGVEVR